jgi:AsmA family protein
MRLKTILIDVIVLLVVILGGAVALVISIDFNQYRGLIAQQVKQATGRELTIAGDFRLALSLRPAVAIDGLSLASFPGGSRPQLVTLKRLELQVQLLPLLSHRINVDRLALAAPIFFWSPTGTAAATGSCPAAALPRPSATVLPRVGLVHIAGAAIGSAWETGVTPSNEG